MTKTHLHCTECGATILDEAKYCFKCGRLLVKPPSGQSGHYRLEARYKSLISSFSTNLKYSSNRRIWLVDGGFERLQLFVNELCSLAYAKSASVSPFESKNRCYDAISEIHFDRYATDFFPPDGYESIFAEFHDFIPSPFGNQGVGKSDVNFDRQIRIFLGRIEHDPEHGKGNASHTERPRFRKSKLIEKWGIDVVHRFSARKPTFDFSFSLDASGYSILNPYGPNHDGLLATLGLVVVTGGASMYSMVKGKSVNSLPGVSKALSDNNASIIYESIHEEEWHSSSRTWTPFVDATVSTGWFSSEKRRIYLPAYRGMQSG